jgi:hypothetical protein
MVQLLNDSTATLDDQLAFFSGGILAVMRPYTDGESLYNIIKTAIPNFAEADYPLFVEFVSAYLRFLEQKRTFIAEIFPDFGAQNNDRARPQHARRDALRKRASCSNTGTRRPRWTSSRRTSSTCSARTSPATATSRSTCSSPRCATSTAARAPSIASSTSSGRLFNSKPKSTSRATTS